MAEGALGVKTGYGDGYGYGSSYGYGDGYGDGYGYGYGDGDEKEAYLKVILESYRLKGVLAFWRSDKDGKPSNGGTGEPRTVGMLEEIEGPLKICTKNALHGTLDPSKWKGERWWLVRLFEPVQRQGDKIGSLKREIIADLGKCPF